MKQRLWVVEMFIVDCAAGSWVATTGVAFSRAHGREEMAHWRCSDPDDRFRLVSYEPASRGRGKA